MNGRRSRVLIEFVEEHKILKTALRGWFFRLNRDDFAQIALMSVWETLQTYDDHDDFPLARLAAIRARRAVIDEWRVKFGPRRTKQAHDGAQSIERYKFAGGGTWTEEPQDPRSDFVSRMALWDQLDARLRVLPLRFVALIRPYFYEGLTARECADRAGMTESRFCQILRASRLPSRQKIAPRTITTPTGPKRKRQTA